MGSTPVYTAVWEKRNGRDERIITIGQPWSNYQQHFDEKFKAGYIIDIVGGNDHDGYFSVWRIRSGQGFWGHHHMTESRLIMRVQELKERNYKLAYVSGYVLENTNDLRFAVIFYSNPKGDPWRYHLGMTKKDLISKVGTYAEEGLQIVHINSYKSGKNTRYAAIWNNNDGKNASLEIELSPILLNSSIISNKARGKSLKQITGV